MSVATTAPLCTTCGAPRPRADDGHGYYWCPVCPRFIAPLGADDEGESSPSPERDLD